MILHFIFVARQFFFSRMPYYAVAKGRKPGIYGTWDECSTQVLKFPGSMYKKFATESEAQNFIKGRSSSNVGTNLTKNFVSLKMVKPVESQVLPKQVFLLGSKQTAVAQTKLLSSLSKRTLLTNSNTNEQPSKKRKIISDNTDFTLTQLSDQDGKVDFIMDEDGYVNVFTDGACSSNGYKNARAGIGVWFQDNHPLNVSRPVEGRPTNNMAEIQAVTVAARQAKKAGIKKLKINTDSKFLISCIMQWMPGWKKRGWRTVDNKPVINKTELLEMEKELKSLTIAWNHVNGHVGIHGNEMADKLARKGCLLYK
ncbi:ribonuclease H1-like isoform X1 [Formica exsecta]|uniref:ribonuclease H1-like isoform X1 n=2 Tax=Formica exsecta TaxID=72781 RepID=UPI0011427AFC|nr:ribonuclease H1-like isoform X1 [Formica exsecta]XP_029662747.1 ribonuclease H1-like isoform X1 [Formica exsecta]XP_029662748.1 ribonuclease H1-like isoform X1 [Formica exsecta]XP_029662749.1 ribonuclease H1-like isoform X1 [Formica exsecta]XP_029662750.1 ribonuclease H1-like isoform X1 [Formica exsecta]XP_029662751.1 ribonuclease H1-like isoform X1 [Formica exsecta]